MKKPTLPPLTVPSALVACNAAEKALHAAFAASVNGLGKGDKLAQKARLKAQKEADVVYHMALLNLHRACKSAERQEGLPWNYVTHGNPNTYREEQEIIDYHRRIRSEAEQ